MDPTVCIFLQILVSFIIFSISNSAVTERKVLNHASLIESLNNKSTSAQYEVEHNECSCGENSKACRYDNGQKICECLEHYIDDGGTCKETCDETNTCKNGGTCLEVGKLKFCKCMEGTEGDLCEIATGCGTLECGSETECKFIIPDKKSVCVCKIPGFGYNSSDRQRRQTCDVRNPCKNGGTCPRNGNWRFCECVEGTEGDLCEITGCATLDCGSEAVCKFIIADKESVCVCKIPGLSYDYSGKKCKKPCDVTNTCKNGGTCLEDWKLKFCKCIEGTEGYFCETATGCATLDCGSEAECKFIIPEKKSGCVCKTPGLSYDSSDRKCKKKCVDAYDCQNGAKCLYSECRCLPNTSGWFCEDIDCRKLEDTCTESGGKCAYDVKRQTSICDCPTDKIYNKKTGKCEVKNYVCNSKFHNCLQTDGKCIENSEGAIHCDCGADREYKGNSGCEVPNYVCNSKFHKCLRTDGKCIKTSEGAIHCDCGAHREYKVNSGCQVPADTCAKVLQTVRELVENVSEKMKEYSVIVLQEDSGL